MHPFTELKIHEHNVRVKALEKLSVQAKSIHAKRNSMKGKV